MEKKTYYVAVSHGEILPEPPFNYEFVIQATDDELDKLQELFEDTSEAATSTAARATIPFREYSHDKENDWYDTNLQQIYQALHYLGTPETRKHIESMNVLPQKE
ncbi:hypothetical protein [Paenibacillus sp. J2TS4]|uniref:hypothetical protein n=1 Tax=Paenibacillus sp. J2TS4 TaxID=2807194 RepID=UPI001B1B9281|nr:hypothetical protein [Paenibacillus sp. J2TS4]GIP33964.1 hypothetical protein J2TS4_31740 [Paenibacillus sp. J2TS4]